MKHFVWVLVLVVGAALFESIRRVLLMTDNPNLVPALILLGACIAPVAFVSFVSQQALNYSVSAAVVSSVALIGGTVGVVLAGLFEYDTVRRLGFMPMLAVGLIEESVKLAGPAAVLIFTRRRLPQNGLLLGVAAGAGFAALETMGYGFVALIRSGGNVSAVDEILLWRGMLSPAAHMAWTGLASAALWSAAADHWSKTSMRRFLGAFATAIVLHTIWDSVGTLPMYAVLAIISLGALGRIAQSLSSPADSAV